jgi:predicted DNA binding CopG/RHH family protein
MKKVAFNTPRKVAATDADEWVQNSRQSDTEATTALATASSSSPAEAMKRFTIDVPNELHRRIKTQCAMRGAKMADVLREILEREFPKA